MAFDNLHTGYTLRIHHGEERNCGFTSNNPPPPQWRAPGIEPVTSSDTNCEDQALTIAPKAIAGVKIREVRELKGAKVEFGGYGGSVVGKEKVRGHGECNMYLEEGTNGQRMEFQYGARLRYNGDQTATSDGGSAEEVSRSRKKSETAGISEFQMIVPNDQPSHNNQGVIRGNGLSLFISDGPPIDQMALDDNRTIHLANASGSESRKLKKWTRVTQNLGKSTTKDSTSIMRYGKRKKNTGKELFKGDSEKCENGG
ncbi:hypothetical protein LguiA_022421 [Lonicera macranthoides]